MIVPRRVCLDKLFPVESAIRRALAAVEATGADVRLTDATNLLGTALDRVADFLEDPKSTIVNTLRCHECGGAGKLVQGHKGHGLNEPSNAINVTCFQCHGIGRVPFVERPSFLHVYMGMATLLARRSTCARLQVGCVITSDDFRKVLAVGYNGGASGLENECASREPGQCGHLHAEENAAIGCDAPRTAPKIVFVTNSPCAMCAKRLINLGGVQSVYFRTPYRDPAPLALLERARIHVEHFPEGDPPCAL